MKTSKRLLSLLLALIMVIAVCPVIALSAVEAAPVSDEAKWDGKVPFTAEDEANWLTLKEAYAKARQQQVALMAAQQPVVALYSATKDQLKPYIDLDTKEIKNAEGLAIFSLLFADLMTTSELGNNFHGATYGATWKLAANIDLNNQPWVPISNNGRSNWNAFTFDGQGYVISNMKIDASVAEDVTNGLYPAYGLFGVLNCQGSPCTVKNVALINSSVYVDNDTVKEGDKAVDLGGGMWTGENVKNVYAAGLVARADNTKGLIIENCVVHCNVKAVSHGAGNAVAGFANSKSSVAVGGVYTLSIAQDAILQINDVVFNGSVTLDFKAETLDTGVKSVSGAANAGESGAIFVGQNYQGFKTPSNLLSLCAEQNIFRCAQMSAEAGAMTETPKNIYGYKVYTGNNANGWATQWGQWLTTGAKTTLSDAISGTAATALVAAGWTQPNKNFVPVPNVFGANTQMVAAAASGVALIGTAAELDAWNKGGYKSNPNLILNADIDMSGYTWTPLDVYAGTIDGNGHVVSNLSSKGAGGLIATANEGTTICNIAFKNIDVTAVGLQYGGVICATKGGTVTLSNVLVQGNFITESSTGEKRFGTVSGYSNGALRVTDCALIVNFYGDFSAVYHYGAGPNGVAATNSYEITNVAMANGWDHGGAFNNSANVYATGTLSSPIAGGSHSAMSTYANADFVAAVYAKAEKTGVVEAADMFGNAMKLGDAWYTYADGTPVQKCFGATADAAKALSYTGAQQAGGVVEIATAQQLLAYANNYNRGIFADAVLTADIVLNDTSDPNWYKKDGLVEWPILKGYKNVFDGNGYTIEGLYFKKTLAANDTGNYGFVDANSGAMTVKNVGFINGRFEVYRNAGLKTVVLETLDEGETYIAHYLTYNKKWWGGAISYVGGIVGMAKADVTIDNVYNDIDLVVSTGSELTGDGASIRAGGLTAFVQAGNFVASKVQNVGTLFADIRTTVHSISDYLGKNLEVHKFEYNEDGTYLIRPGTAGYKCEKVSNVVLTEEIIAKIAEENRTFTQTGGIQYGSAWCCHWGAKLISISDSLFVGNIVTNTQDNAGIDGAFTQAGKDAGSEVFSFTNVYSTTWSRFSEHGVKTISVADMVLFGVESEAFVAVDGDIPVLADFADKVDGILGDLIFHNLGASLRTTEVGIRFSFELNQKLLAAEGVSYGVLVIPAKGLNGELTLDTEGALDIVVPEEGILGADSEYANLNKWNFGTSGSQLNVALLGVPEAAYGTEFVVRAYAWVESADGDVSIVYGDTMIRSIDQVYNAIMEDANVADKSVYENLYGAN